MRVEDIPNIDFNLIPDDLSGKWVVVRVGGAGQEVLASGNSPAEAMKRSRVSKDDLSAILTKVPVPTAVAYMGTASAEDE